MYEKSYEIYSIIIFYLKENIKMIVLVKFKKIYLEN